jgi:hypothetical protein
VNPVLCVLETCLGGVLALVFAVPNTAGLCYTTIADLAGLVLGASGILRPIHMCEMSLVLARAGVQVLNDMGASAAQKHK